MTNEDKAEFGADRTGWITPPKDTDLKLNLDRKARPRTGQGKIPLGNEYDSLHPDSENTLCSAKSG